MTKLAHHSGYKSLNILCLQTCWWVAKWIHLTVKKPSRKCQNSRGVINWCTSPLSYKNDPQIKAMTDLVDAYQRREVHSAEKILRGAWSNIHPFKLIISVDNRSTIMDDSFIRSYIGELLRSLRTQYLIDLIKPYTRLELSFLAKVCKSRSWSIPDSSSISNSMLMRKKWKSYSLV